MRDRIKLDNLLLALDNPRLTDSQSETEEIEKIVREQKDKLVILAEDIIDFGLNPLDIIAVYPSEKYENKYVVAEGNRRVAALKILNDPDIISTYDLSIFSKFTKLKLKYLKPIVELDSWIFTNSIDPALIHWIEIRHMGEQKGKGVSKWDSVQKERFDKKVRGESRLLDFWIELEKYNILSYDEIMSITKTNWERILRESGIKFLGIYRSGNSLIIPKDNLEEFIKKIKCMQRRLANQTVGIVYDQEKIDTFFDEVSKELYGIIPEKPEQLTINGPLNLSDRKETNTDNSNLPASLNIVPEEIITNPGIQKGESEDQNHNAQNTKPIKGNFDISKDLFNGCKSIIPYAYSIRSSNTRINKIIRELKLLPVDEYPNSCGALLRCLFELSSKLYLERKQGNDKTDDEFLKVLRNAANELRSEGRINDNAHSALLKDADILRLLFNGYMHDTDSYPSSEALKSIFKAHKIFITECLK